MKEKRQRTVSACYIHTKTEQSLHADVILHSYMSQTITAAAKLAADFTSLSPDVWASDVLLEVPNTEMTQARQHMPSEHYRVCVQSK
ncbi:hypothetical protein ABVT39_016062, partial [Epinephelus coioides]